MGAQGAEITEGYAGVRTEEGGNPGAGNTGAEPARMSRHASLTQGRTMFLTEAGTYHPIGSTQGDSGILV